MEVQPTGKPGSVTVITIPLSGASQSASTLQLPFKIHQIPSNRDYKAPNRGTLGGLGGRNWFLSIELEASYKYHRPPSAWADCGLRRVSASRTGSWGLLRALIYP